MLLGTSEEVDNIFYTEDLLCCINTVIFLIPFCITFTVSYSQFQNQLEIIETRQYCSSSVICLNNMFRICKFHFGDETAPAVPPPPRTHTLASLLRSFFLRNRYALSKELSSGVDLVAANFVLAIQIYRVYLKSRQNFTECQDAAVRTNLVAECMVGTQAGRS